MRKNVVGVVPPAALAAALALADSAAACSLEHVPWQRGAVWPTRETSAPLNTHVYVWIPAAFGAPLLKPRACAATRCSVAAPLEEPVASQARALSLREATGPGGASAEVPTRWRARSDEAGVLFELTPRSPLRPRTEYFVLAEAEDGPQRLGLGFRTGDQRDERAPEWAGLKGAAYRPARRSPTGGGDCGFLLDHGPQAELTLHGATDEGPVRYAVWLARPGEALPYGDTPRAYLVPSQGRLTVDGLPKGLPRVRIGVRACDAAGNMSPPSEVELPLPPDAP